MHPHPEHHLLVHRTDHTELARRATVRRWLRELRPARRPTSEPAPTPGIAITVAGSLRPTDGWRPARALS